MAAWCGWPHARRLAGSLAVATLLPCRNGEILPDDTLQALPGSHESEAGANAELRCQREFLHDDDFRRGRRGDVAGGLAAATARAAAARRRTGHHFLNERTALAAAQGHAEVDLEIFHRSGASVETGLDLALGDGFADANDHDENVKM